MSNIDNYLNILLRKIDLPYKEKLDLKLQFKDHISSLKDNYISAGYDTTEASRLAIEAFNTDEFFIKSFTDNSTKLSHIARLIALIVFLAISICCIIIFRFVIHLSVQDSLNDLIPFNFALQFIENVMNKGFFNLTGINEQRFVLTLFCIPIGFLLPIIINRFNSCIPSLKFFNMFVILLELIDKHRNIDFIIFPNLAFLLGYFALKMIIRLNNMFFNKTK